MLQHTTTRRLLLKSSIFGLISVPLNNVLHAQNPTAFQGLSGLPHDRYPAIPLDAVSEVVGLSHFDLDKVKALVDTRPELAKAVWDWGFGDWESAIGAASHVGRKDIVDYLIGKGAAPTIFTLAMLGANEAVKSMIKAYPGIQKSLGPHGFSLLHHARLGLTIEGVRKSNAQKLVDYLEKLGDADGQQYLALEASAKEKYLGDYRYGDKENEGFSVKLNMRKLLSLGKLGKFGGALYNIGPHTFVYNGAPSVLVVFNLEHDKVVSLTIKEPNFSVTAGKS